MKKNAVLTFLVACLFIAACERKQNYPNPEEQELKSVLVGSWSLVSVDLDVPSLNGSLVDSSYYLEQSFFGESFGFENAVTFLNEDGSCKREYWNDADEIFKEYTGNWTVTGNSGKYLLSFHFYSADSNFTQHFELSRRGDNAVWHWTTDFDGDGSEDDRIKGVMVKK